MKKLVVTLLVALSLLAVTAPSQAAGGGRTPAPCRHLQQCRDKIVRLQQAITWQRHARVVAAGRTYDTEYGIRLAVAAFGADASDMRTICGCESGCGRQKYAESGTGAAGSFQFLPSTWRHTPFAGFDVFDPVANSLAAAWLHAKDGSWREWSCSSITGVR
jgi:hypothetical protein